VLRAIWYAVNGCRCDGRGRRMGCRTWRRRIGWGESAETTGAGCIRHMGGGLKRVTASWLYCKQSRKLRLPHTLRQTCSPWWCVVLESSSSVGEVRWLLKVGPASPSQKLRLNVDHRGRHPVRPLHSKLVSAVSRSICRASSLRVLHMHRRCHAPLLGRVRLSLLRPDSHRH